jgi:NAD(P)-dependent dehydrogenase (short-subunit alcohol dehydrogenase family)
VGKEMLFVACELCEKHHSCKGAAMTAARMVHLEGKVAIITGASRGIGEAIATTFAAHGASVMLASRKAESLEQVRDKIRQAGGTAQFQACHTGQREQISALVTATVQAFGKVDILINNAATNPYFGPMLGIDDGAYLKTFEVNLKGYFDASRAVAQHLMARKAPGSIVNIASVAGLGGAPFQGVYGMTKAAIVSMTQTMSIELGSLGIRINTIAPGLIDTKFASALTSNPEIIEKVKARTSLGRVGTPDEIASGALFLASDAASFVTGHTLVIDGGLTTGVGFLSPYSPFILKEIFV